jgi:uncharacterized protein with HEPN domain
VLAESTQRLSEELKAKYPDVKWRSVSAFRNVVVHHYLGLDLNVTWDIIERDLPELKAQMKAIVAAEA